MFRRFVTGFAVVAAMVFLFALPASAQQRIALVIGNAAYAKGPIKGSLADGGLVAEALSSVGFEIVEGADVNQADLRRLFREFLAKVDAAGPDAIAFVYYSGYGIEFEGENYLIPVDARLERDSDIPMDTVRLFDLLRPLADSPAMAKVVVLDATRPLPFRIQGGRLARGLGAIASARGMLVGFSSAPGTVAQDGPGPYGAYASAIAEMVREPGLDLATMFARIRVRTHQATEGAQTPWNVEQDLNRQAMLVPGAPAAVAAPVAPRRASRQMRDIGPEEAYAMAIEEDTLEGYTEFVRAYPNGPYTARVFAIIRERREALAWRRALLINTPEAYWTYLERYPGGMYAFDAERRLRRLSAGLRPPSGFRGLEFIDVPPPLAGEPTGLIEVYPAAPPPRFLGPPPAFMVGLPPPGRPSGGHGLWRRQNNPFPVIIGPRGGPQGIIAPSGGIPLQKNGPVIVNQPPLGSTPPGFTGPQPGWAKPGTGIPGPTGPAKGTKELKKTGPAVVTTPPPGSTPPGFTGPQPGWAKPGTGIPGPTGPAKGTKELKKTGPAVVTTPPPGSTPPGPPAGSPPKGFTGPQPGWAKPGTGIPATTTQPQMKVVTPPPTPPAPPKPPTAPVVTGTQPKSGTAATGQGQGQKKNCVIVNGQPVCK